MSEDPADHYPSVRRDPRELRTRAANRTAALAAVAALLIVILAIALFA